VAFRGGAQRCANSTPEKDTTMAALVDFDQLYPGRFIKAGELLGKKVTLTVTDIAHEELVGDDGKPSTKVTLSFKETPKRHVCCKTNAICMREMFGRKLPEWKGKRVTFFPDTWNGEPAIRVWGSPDITKEIEVTVTLPRRKPFKKVMHPTGKAADAPAKAPEPEPTQDEDPAMAGVG
jgi:hypothetical protein